MSAFLAAIAPVILVLLQALIPLAVEKANAPTIAVDADDTSGLRDRLLRRLQQWAESGAGA